MGEVPADLLVRRGKGCMVLSCRGGDRPTHVWESPLASPRRHDEGQRGIPGQGGMVIVQPGLNLAKGDFPAK